VTFNSSPFYVRIPSGSTASSEQKFNVPDGTVTSMWGVYAQSGDHQCGRCSLFLGVEDATVYVQNVAPTITRRLRPTV
jgi:hypothetical protein